MQTGFPGYDEFGLRGIGIDAVRGWTWTSPAQLKREIFLRACARISSIRTAGRVGRPAR